jgi:histone H3/H4
MRIEEATVSTVTDLWTQLQPRVESSESLENAAQELATALHSQFDESVVIARVFVTVPFDTLPEVNRDFVQKLAESAGVASDLKTGTPVLSLVGSHGQEEDWNDRRKSKGHVGIPLISSSFVDAIPMISRLLKELGVPLDWVDSHDSEIIVQTLSGATGLFFVEDAGEATDQEGRKIIAAQDFVSSYDVKSVFGTGGVYPNGQMVVVVVFCRDSFARAEAEQFLALTQLFKGETTSLAGSAAIFSH